MKTLSKYTSNDFLQIQWHEYQTAAEYVTQQIVEFCNKHNKRIDFVVPILRGGAPLAISISHAIGVIPFYPCQYKYSFDSLGHNYLPTELLSTIEKIEDKSVAYNILVTEGNHVRGITAQKCINKIRSIFPQATIIYASVGRDYNHQQPLNNTDFETWGFLTNETESLNCDECRTLSVKEKFVVYPWENVEEELMEVNNSLECDEN